MPTDHDSQRQQPPPIRTFTYMTSAAAKRTVRAAHLEFAPGHVVFRDVRRRVIRAVRNDLVVDLREEGAYTGDDDD